MRMFATEVLEVPGLLPNVAPVDCLGQKVMPKCLAVDWLLMYGRHGAVRQVTKGRTLQSRTWWQASLKRITAVIVR